MVQAALPSTTQCAMCIQLQPVLLGFDPGDPSRQQQSGQSNRIRAAPRAFAGLIGGCFWSTLVSRPRALPHALTITIPAAAAADPAAAWPREGAQAVSHGAAVHRPHNPS